MLWFLVKTLIFLFVYIWLRGTLPRLRYDQFMRLGWKFLVPISLVWIVAVIAVRDIKAALRLHRPTAAGDPRLCRGGRAGDRVPGAGAQAAGQRRCK